MTHQTQSTNTQDTVNQTLSFKTNINCSGCVSKVKPLLDEASGICHWNVDTDNKEKILSVHSAGISAGDIIATVKKAGFNIEQIIQ
jgi:copper chaperone